MTLNTGTLTVTRAPLVVTPDSVVETYGGAAALTGQITGEQPGDTFTASYASAGAAAGAAAGSYAITVAGVSGPRLADYDVIAKPATLTVNPAPVSATSQPGGTPAAIPLVTVPSVAIENHKVSRKKTVKVFVVDYSGALEPGPAANPNSYHLVAAVKGKKLGTRAQRAVAIASATYSPTAPSVTLTLAGKLPVGPLVLTITAASVLDAEGRALDGTNNGQPGGNFQTTLSG